MRFVVFYRNISPQSLCIGHWHVHAWIEPYAYETEHDNSCTHCLDTTLLFRCPRPHPPVAVTLSASVAFLSRLSDGDCHLKLVAWLNSVRDLDLELSPF